MFVVSVVVFSCEFYGFEVMVWCVVEWFLKVFWCIVFSIQFCVLCLVVVVCVSEVRCLLLLILYRCILCRIRCVLFFVCSCLLLLVVFRNVLFLCVQMFWQCVVLSVLFQCVLILMLLVLFWFYGFSVLLLNIIIVVSSDSVIVIDMFSCLCDRFSVCSVVSFEVVVSCFSFISVLIIVVVGKKVQVWCGIVYSIQVVVWLVVQLFLFMFLNLLENVIIMFSLIRIVQVSRIVLNIVWFRQKLNCMGCSFMWFFGDVIVCCCGNIFRWLVLVMVGLVIIGLYCWVFCYW